MDLTPTVAIGFGLSKGRYPTAYYRLSNGMTHTIPGRFRSRRLARVYAKRRLHVATPTFMQPAVPVNFIELNIVLTKQDNIWQIGDIEQAESRRRN